MAGGEGKSVNAKGGGGGESIIYDDNRNDTKKTRHLLDVISLIESFAVAEKNKAQLPEELFTTKDRIEFWTIGLKIIIQSGIFTVLMMPFAVSGIEDKLPIFGSTNPSSFDEFFVMLYTVSLSLMYGILLFSLKRNFVGKMTGIMIKSLYSGVTIGLSIKVLVSFIYYHWLYFFVLTPKHIYEMLKWCIKWKVIKDVEFAKSVYVWLVNTRGDLLASFWFVFFTCIIFLGFIWAGYYIRYKKVYE
jgi:hypothetical protein